MADISAFIQALQQNLIEPLKNLPETQLKALDTTHDQSVSNFQKAIGRLYEPSVQFEGKTSEALADLLSQYYSAENKLTPYMSDGLSDHISKLLQFCHQVVNDLVPKLKDLQGTDPLELGGQVLVTEETGAAMGGDETPAVPLVQLICVVVAGTAVMVGQGIQEWKMWDAYDTMHQWEMNMSGLGAQAESTLPASPNFSVDVTLDLAARDGLTPAQQQEVATVITQLTAHGYSVNQWEVEELAKLGYNAATIIAILTSLNDGTTNTYLKGQPGQNQIVDFFSGLITYLTLEATSNLRFLQSGYESRKPGQSIRSIIPNYDKLPKSVRDWLLMTPKDPMYYTTFGNAVEDLVDMRLKQLPEYQTWKKQYGLQLNASLPNNPRLFPDVQFRLPKTPCRIVCKGEQASREKPLRR